MLRIFLVVSLLAVTLVDHAASAEEFESCRCSQGIAGKGDLKPEVLQKCGQPAYVDYPQDRDCNEMWVYNFGPNEFMQAICFDRHGRLNKVLSLNTGY